MTKIMKFANLSLCVTAFTAMAHADRITLAPDYFAALPEEATPGLAASSFKNTQIGFDQSIGLLGMFDYGETASEFGKIPKDHLDRVFDKYRQGSGNHGGAPHVPDSAGTLELIGLSALGLVAMRRKLRN